MKDFDYWLEFGASEGGYSKWDGDCEHEDGSVDEIEPSDEELDQLEEERSIIGF